MKELIWQASYNIGIEEIDRQHMEFIKLLRRFNYGVQQQAGPLGVRLRILQEIVKYAEYHFVSEENIMCFTRYPGLRTHQSDHSRILNCLGRKVEAYSTAPDTGETLSDFLYNWFVDHTQVEDRKIAAHIQREKLDAASRPD